jgi:hypothetical protein
VNNPVSTEPTSANLVETHNLPDGTLVLPVDREHTGIRLVGCGSLVIVWVLAFGVSTVLLRLNPLFGLLLALIAAVLVTMLVERTLKGNWLSGRELFADEAQILLRKRGEIERTINPQQHVNVLSWHFVVDRSRRVRKGWHVVGLSLEQEGEFVPVYTLASPENFEAITKIHPFTKLERPKPTDDKTKANLRQAGEQRRLLEAEQDRGYNGAELTVDEFIAYLSHLQTRYPSWMGE